MCVYLGGIGLVGCCRLWVVLSDSLHVGSVIPIRGHCRDLKYQQVQMLNTVSPAAFIISVGKNHAAAANAKTETKHWNQIKKALTWKTIVLFVRILYIFYWQKDALLVFQRGGDTFCVHAEDESQLYVNMLFLWTEFIQLKCTSWFDFFSAQSLRTLNLPDVPWTLDLCGNATNQSWNNLKSPLK